MPQVIDSSSFTDFNDNLTIFFEKNFDMAYDSSVDQLYNMHDTAVDTGDISGIDGFGFAKRKGEGADHGFGTLAQFYRKSWHTYEVSLETKITWNMRKYAKYPDIMDRIQNLAGAVADRMVLDKTHRLTFATSTSYTDMDGVSVNVAMGDGYALAYSAHTVTGSSSTFRNRVSGDPIISKGGIEAAELLFSSQMITTTGKVVKRKPNAIFTGDDPNTINTVKQYLGSYADPEAAQAGVINPYNGKYQHIVLPYLATTAAGAYDSTKAKWWGLADLTRKALHCFVGQAPTFITPQQGQGIEFETMDWKYAAFASYALVGNDPRGIVMSCPTS